MKKNLSLLSRKNNAKETINFKYKNTKCLKLKSSRWTKT